MVCAENGKSSRLGIRPSGCRHAHVCHPFAETQNVMSSRLDYIEGCGVNYLHLMPLIESPKDYSDGGYAVSSFRRVEPELGTMEDLLHLTTTRLNVVCLSRPCHENIPVRNMSEQSRHVQEIRNIRAATSSMTPGISRANMKKQFPRPSRQRHLGTFPGAARLIKW